MAKAREPDPLLDSLLDELRNCVRTANDLHHPVNPVDPQRIAQYEARISELRASIRARRQELNQAQSAAPSDDDSSSDSAA